MVKHQYFKDPCWYAAFVIAGVVWGLMDMFVQPITPRNLLHSPEIILFPILLYPVLEEIVFRGLIQGQLILREPWRQQLWGISGANVLTSVMFSALHFVHQAPLMAALVFFPSLVFGYFRDRYQRLLPSICLHIFYNAGFLSLFVFVYPE